ncbi:hypothetical protein CYMTET_33123, partial [Cymbomonas tetramitiformis]
EQMEAAAKEGEEKLRGAEGERQRLEQELQGAKEHMEVAAKEAQEKLEEAMTEADMMERDLADKLQAADRARQIVEQQLGAREDMVVAIKEAENNAQLAQAEVESLRELLAAAQKASAGERGREGTVAVEVQSLSSEGTLPGSTSPGSPSPGSPSPGGGRRSLLGRVFRRGSQMEQPKGAPDAAEVSRLNEERARLQDDLKLAQVEAESLREQLAASLVAAVNGGAEAAGKEASTREELGAELAGTQEELRAAQAEAESLREQLAAAAVAKAGDANVAAASGEETSAREGGTKMMEAMKQAVERLQGIQEEREALTSESGQELSESGRERLAQEEGSLLALLRQQQEEEERERQAMEEEMVRLAAEAERLRSELAAGAVSKADVADAAEAGLAQESEAAKEERLMEAEQLRAQLAAFEECIKEAEVDLGLPAVDEPHVGATADVVEEGRVFLVLCHVSDSDVRGADVRAPSMSNEMEANWRALEEDRRRLESQLQVARGEMEAAAKDSQVVANVLLDAAARDADEKYQGVEEERQRLEQELQSCRRRGTDGGGAKEGEEKMRVLRQEKQLTEQELQEARADGGGGGGGRGEDAGCVGAEGEKQRLEELQEAKEQDGGGGEGGRGEDAGSRGEKQRLSRSCRRRGTDRGGGSEGEQEKMRGAEAAEQELQEAKEQMEVALKEGEEKMREDADAEGEKQRLEQELQEAGAELRWRRGGQERMRGAEGERQRLEQELQEAKEQMEAAAKEGKEKLRLLQVEAEKLREQLAAARMASAGERGREDSVAVEVQSLSSEGTLPGSPSPGSPSPGSASPGGGRRSLLGRVFRRGSQMEQPKGAPDAAEVSRLNEERARLQDDLKLAQVEAESLREQLAASLVAAVNGGAEAAGKEASTRRRRRASWLSGSSGGMHTATRCGSETGEEIERKVEGGSKMMEVMKQAVERLQGIQEEREASTSESGQELSESDRERLAQEEGSLLALLRQQQEEEERERQAMEEEMLRRGGAAQRLQLQTLGEELASTQAALRAAEEEVKMLQEQQVPGTEHEEEGSELVYRLREALAQLQDEVEQLHAERAEEGAQGEDTKPALALVGGARHKRRDSQVFKAVEALNKSMTSKAGARKSVGFDEETMLASRWQVEDLEEPGDVNEPHAKSSERKFGRQAEDSGDVNEPDDAPGGRRLEYKEQEEQTEDRLLALLRTQQEEEEREANELQELAMSAKQDAVKLHWKQAASSAKLDEERRSRRQSRANWSKAVEALQHQGERAQEQLDASELFFQSQVEAATKQHQKEKDQWAKQIKQVREEQMSTEMHLMQECE